MHPRPVFTVAGIPIRIQAWFFVVIVALGLLFPWPYQLTWVVIATASVLVHELGHALMFKAFGLRPRITLHAMGGLTSASLDDPGAPPFTPWKSILTSLAGPLAALVLFGLPAYLVAQSQGFDPWLLVRGTVVRHPQPAQFLLAQVVWINVGWSLVNLVPILPLDGGNVTASVFELISPRRGRRIANVTSIASAGALGIYGLTNVSGFTPMLVAFGAIFAGINVAELTRSGDDDAEHDLAQATRALLDYDPAAAERLARSAFARGLTGERLRWATELVAWSRLAAGDVHGAQHLVVTMPAGAGPSASLRGALALAYGNAAEGVAVLAWAFSHDGDRNAQIFAAIAAAQAGQVAALTHELLLVGPAGVQGAHVLRGLLEYTGHHADAATVANLLAHPSPPGW